MQNSNVSFVKIENYFTERNRVKCEKLAYVFEMRAKNVLNGIRTLRGLNYALANENIKNGKKIC